MQRIVSLTLSIVLLLSGKVSLQAQTYLVADQDAWPGRILAIRSADRDSQVYWQRGPASSDAIVPKIQSLTLLRDGTIAFCSGLDRSVRAVDRSGEYELHYGGSLVRQVRTDTSGDLYWSGLETPAEGNPLPDGFITRKRANTGQVETLLTFSQGLVGSDWWGSFDVREGQIFIATHHSPSKIYVLENSLPRLLSTLPIAVSSFRIESATSLLALDRNGRLYRFPNFSNDPQQHEIVTERPIKLVDFVVAP